VVVCGFWSVVRGFRLLFVVVHCLPASFRTVTWRQASPLGRGDVGTRCRPPAGGRQWWRRISWVILIEVDEGVLTLLNINRRRRRRLSSSSSSLAPSRRPSLSAWVACARSWALAVVCGLGWAVAVVLVRFRGFVVVFGRSLSFLGGRSRFRAVVFDRGPLGSTWWRRGRWSWASCFVCGRGVVGVVVVVVVALVEENKSRHKL
jgi:hypothetical protein